MLDIKLERPLVIFDLETTGTNISKDRIVELSVIKLMPDGERITKTRKINPEMPIPAVATAIHGITDADVANEPTFQSISRNLLQFLDNCDLGGYNIQKFDIPILVNEFNRAGMQFVVTDRKVVDMYNIFCKLYPRTLIAAYKFFCGKELIEAHSAAADTAATLEVFEQQLTRHPELPRTVDELHIFSDSRDPDAVDSSGRFKWVGSEVVLCFGKNSGSSLSSVAENDPGFLKWILRSDFPEDVKSIAQNALIGKFPTRQ
jgi:DNA polymerase-3 subunit epsilon